METEAKSMNVDEEDIEEGSAKKGEKGEELETIAKRYNYSGIPGPPPQTATPNTGGSGGERPGIGGGPSFARSMTLKSISDAKNGLSKADPVTTNGTPRVTGPTTRTQDASRDASQMTQESPSHEVEGKIKSVLAGKKGRSVVDVQKELLEHKKNPPLFKVPFESKGSRKAQELEYRKIQAANIAESVPSEKKKGRKRLGYQKLGIEYTHPYNKKAAELMSTQGYHTQREAEVKALLKEGLLIRDSVTGKISLPGKKSVVRSAASGGTKKKPTLDQLIGKPSGTSGGTTDSGTLARSIELTHGDQLKKGFPIGGTCGLCKRISKSITENVCEDCQSSMGTTQWHTSHLG